VTLRLRLTPFVLGTVTLGTAIVALPASAAAQRQPAAGAPFMLVTPFRTAGNDKVLAVKAADEMRSQLTARISSRELWVIPKQQIEAYLDGSGYAVDEPLGTLDAKQLGQVLRADEILVASVDKTDDGSFRVRGDVALTRDMSMRDAVAPGEGKTLSQASAEFVRNLQVVRKQLPHERQCNSSLREGNATAAETAARAGIAAYPEAMISRVCLIFALAAAKKAPDEVLAATEDVLSRDPRQPRALYVAMEQFLIKGDTNAMAQTASRLVAVEANDARLVEQIVANLEAMRRADVALPILETALQETPEDPDLMRLQFRLLIASARWKDVIEKGEVLAVVDTASADQKFFERMAAAYQADSQPQKAAEVLARGVSKFPEDPMLQLTLGQILQSIGDYRQAITVLQRAVAIEPKLPNARLLIARAYNELQMPDSVIATLRDAAANGEDKELVSGYAATLANAFVREVNETKSLASARKVLPFAQLAEEIDPTNVNAKFILGLGHFFISQYAAEGLADLIKQDRSAACELAKEGQTSATQAQIYIPQGGRVNPEVAGQLLGVLPNISAYFDQQVPALCR
jgi:tetratricopeptide (TPR) repeat protein